MIFETYFKHVYLYVACLYATSGTGLYAQTLHQHAGTQRDTVPVTFPVQHLEEVVITAGRPGITAGAVSNRISSSEIHRAAGSSLATLLRELTPLIRSSNVASELPAARWISEEEIRLLTAPAVIPGRPAVMTTSSRCCTGNVTGTVSLCVPACWCSVCAYSPVPDVAYRHATYRYTCLKYVSNIIFYMYSKSMSGKYSFGFFPG